VTDLAIYAIVAAFVLYTIGRLGRAIKREYSRKWPTPQGRERGRR
jgi:hypothetical protein